MAPGDVLDRRHHLEAVVSQRCSREHRRLREILERGFRKIKTKLSGVDWETHESGNRFWVSLIDGASRRASWAPRVSAMEGALCLRMRASVRITRAERVECVARTFQSAPSAAHLGSPNRGTRYCLVGATCIGAARVARERYFGIVTEGLAFT
jgi:hypothetical protein